MRRPAAALIPYMPDIDTGIISNLVSDTEPMVRRELAQEITNIKWNVYGSQLPHQQEWITR